jgi:hypothetical protein
MLTPDQAFQLREAGLTAYNHNLDTSPEYYAKVTTTRKYEDRLATLAAVREAGAEESSVYLCFQYHAFLLFKITSLLQLQCLARQSYSCYSSLTCILYHYRPAYPLLDTS